MSYRDRLQHRLDETGRPLRVGLVGAGQMGTGLAAQLLRMPGITLSAVLDVQKERAEPEEGRCEQAAEEVVDAEGARVPPRGGAPGKRCAGDRVREEGARPRGQLRPRSRPPAPCDQSRQPQG